MTVWRCSIEQRSWPSHVHLLWIDIAVNCRIADYGRTPCPHGILFNLWYYLRFVPCCDLSPTSLFILCRISCSKFNVCRFCCRDSCVVNLPMLWKPSYGRNPRQQPLVSPPFWYTDRDKVSQLSSSRFPLDSIIPASDIDLPGKSVVISLLWSSWPCF